MTKKTIWIPCVILATAFFSHLPKLMEGSEVQQTPGNQTKIFRKLDLNLSKLVGYPVNINDRVFAVEKIECSDISGDWILYYEGTITSKESHNLSVKLSRRFAYHYSPRKEGIDDTTWWPSKRHSYTEVKFGDWKGKYVQGQVVPFPKERVFNARIGVVNGMLILLKDECKRGTY